jgi:hypothetical protein
MSGGLALLRDIGAYIKTAFAGYADVVAAGSGDDTEVDGPWVDRLGFESLVASIGFETTLGATETLFIAANLQDADDDAGAGVADFGTVYASALQATGGGGGTTESGTLELDFDLSDAKRYVRLQFTPDLSAGSADIADLVGQLILGGASQIPA